MPAIALPINRTAFCRRESRTRLGRDVGGDPTVLGKQRVLQGQRVSFECDIAADHEVFHDMQPQLAAEHAQKRLVAQLRHPHRGPPVGDRGHQKDRRKPRVEHSGRDHRRGKRNQRRRDLGDLPDARLDRPHTLISALPHQFPEIRVFPGDEFDADRRPVDRLLRGPPHPGHQRALDRSHRAVQQCPHSVGGDDETHRRQ
jgi:hypothetical protein